MLDTYTALRSLAAFQANGYFVRSNQLVVEETRKANIGVLPTYDRLFAALLDILERNDFLRHRGMGKQSITHSGNCDD